MFFNINSLFFNGIEWKIQKLIMINLFHYIKFYLKSTNNHGVHSPFIYGLITFCFYNENWKKKRKNYFLEKNLEKNLEFFRHELNKYLLNYNDKNILDQFFIKLKSNKNPIKLIDTLSIKYSQFILLIDHHNDLSPLIKIIENKNKYLIVDFYFWIIIVKKLGNHSQTFKIRVF